MDFGDSISKLRSASMPLVAIASYELRGLWKSWFVRSWVMATAVVTFFIVASNWEQTSSAPLVAMLLFPYLVFPWFFVVLLMGLSPVTGSRLEALSDGILCRPIHRWEYLLASWAARVLVILCVFAVVIVPSVWIVATANRPSVPDDGITWFGIVSSLVVVSLVLTFLVSLGFFAGTILRSPLFAAAILILFWIPINLVMHTFSLEEFSPISLNQSLPTLLTTAWRSDENQIPEQVDAADMRAAADQAANFLSVLTGQTATVRREPPEFYQRGNYQDFSLTRVLCGYAVPTFLLVGFATVTFYYRDL